ncbi:DNA alkylation repair protein [Mucilaginibacter conchicola]|uniref:DNA alkylation repair protein n=1 Tax=Mucilaginibacter conchicola TaxID=2303333 RepID=A0A372NT93_9SPHI|nr:DNA alkylation repair protein [Mucilaginibacter conchicola]RFZ92475.1 DNA alkylation repair protein [Mucilaginibacter conchicola]
MTTAEVLSQLESLGNDKVRAHNKKFGAGDNQFGVKMGDIRAIANKIKTDHELGKALWETGNVEARFVAVLIMKPKELSADELTAMAKSEQFPHVIDWLSSYILKDHPQKEELRRQWMATGTNGMPARLGWSLTSGRISRAPDGIDIPAILDRLEAEMPTAAPEVQWTMNTALAQIGINHPQYRERALEIGERLGIYRDYPVSKGCTSPFAPIWINEMVSRQK